MSIADVCDLVILVLILQSVFMGFHRGLIITVARIIALIVAYAGAGIIADSAENTQPGINGMMTHAITFFVSFLVLQILLMLLVRLLKVVDHIPIIGFINKLGGAVAGFLWIFMILYVVLNLLLTVVPQVVWDSCGLTRKVMEHTMLLSAFLQDN